MAVSAGTVPDCAQIKFDADNLVELNDVQDVSQTPAVDLTGSPPDATFTDVTDPDNPVVLALSPLAMPEYPAGPSNDYRASFFASAGNGFAVGSRIEIAIDFNGGAGLRRVFTFVALVCE